MTYEFQAKGKKWEADAWYSDWDDEVKIESVAVEVRPMVWQEVPVVDVPEEIEQIIVDLTFDAYKRHEPEGLED